MNSLSWMIYTAELSESVATTCWLVVIFGAVAFGIHGFITVVCENPWDTFRSFWRRASWVLVPALLGGVVLPSKSTIYAIAASEIGEKALQTPTATKAMKALDAWLDRQIAAAPNDSPND